MRLLCLIIAAALMLGGASVAAAQSDGPNILFITADDLSAHAVGALGNEEIQTPNLDRLYGAGFRFDNTYNMGSNSPAVCAPSRAMFMSGQNLGSVWNSSSIGTNTPTIPSELRDAGYTTFGTGKWHGMGQGTFAAGFDFGEDILFSGCIACSSTSNTANQAAMNASYNTTLRKLNANGSFSTVSEPEHVSERFGGATVDFIDGFTGSNPYFTYTSFTAPHDPRVSPAPFNTMYRDANGDPTVSLPDNFMTQTPIDRSAFHGDIRDEVLLNNIGGHTEDNVRAEIADYYGMITHMDVQIGNMIDEAIRAEGLDPSTHTIADLQNTVIVFTSDHGLAMGSHGLMGKQNPYEHSIQSSPLVFAGAVDGQSIQAGSSDAFVYLSDIMPTILDITGTNAPGTVQGQSLAGIMSGDEDSVRDSIYNAYMGRSRAVRQGDWKLMYFPGLDKIQLFNLDDDPLEVNDLSDQHQYRQLIEHLGDELKRLEQELNAPGAGLVPEDFFAALNVNLALGKTATQSSTIASGGDWDAGNAIDGNPGTETHTAVDDFNAWLEVDLESAEDIAQITLLNRDDCCQGRLRDLTIQVLDADRNVVFTSDLLNEDNAEGGGLNDFDDGPGSLTVDLSTLGITGQFVRVTRDPASVNGPGASDQEVLSLGELQIFGFPGADDFLLGDLTGDGFVGAEDLDILLANWGAEGVPGDPTLGDANADGVTNNADLQLIIANWGDGEPPEVVIPEPASALSLGGLMMLCMRRGAR